MNKGTIQADIAETLLELGKTTTRQSVKAVTGALNPTELLQSAIRPGVTEDKLTGEKINNEKVPNSSKIDMTALKEKYGKQDQENITAMRNRLFKLVKEGEEKAIADRRREEQERMKEERAVTEEQKQKEQQLSQQPQDIPKGKERRSILGAHKKKADLSHAETKPSVSKG